MIILGLLESA